MDTFKSSVTEAVQFHFPDDVEELQQLTEEAWIEYKEAIEQYQGGEWRAQGWYSSIYFTMFDSGIDDRLAHVLASIRQDVEQ